ncbi:MAG: hypothetical protein ACREUT_16875 [Steroidobacteraceae bacterium]
MIKRGTPGLSRRSAGIGLVLVLTISISYTIWAAQTAPQGDGTATRASQVTSTGLIAFNYKDTDIGQVVAALQKAVHKTFVVDPRVHATVTMMSSKLMSPADFYQAFVDVLRAKHILVAESSRGDFIKIEPETDPL